MPVAASPTLRNTVAYVLDQAVEAGTPATVHFVYAAATRQVDPDSGADFDDATELLERIEVWAEEDLDPDDEGDRPAVDIETAIVGRNRYLFSPGDYADALLSYAEGHAVERIVLDPEYNPAGTAPMLQPLAVELTRGDYEVEEAPVDRQTRPTVLARAGTAAKYAGVFVATYLFYLLLGDPTYWFDLATGAVTAGIVAGVLGRVTFAHQPDYPRIFRQFLRFLLYVPYLLWEITKANVTLAYVVLHPSLPIDPKFVELRAAVWGDLPVTTLANSITLTPGTLTVEVSQRAFTIHSLTVDSREDLFDGALERAVRFVYYGRSAARIASPKERHDTDEEGEN